MAEDLGKIMAERFKQIRKAIGTQEEFADAAGYSQAQISRLENNASAWSQIKRVGEAIERAGGDPYDMLSQAPPADTRIAEIRRLLPMMTDETVDIVLRTLQNEIRLRGLDSKVG